MNSIFLAAHARLMKSEGGYSNRSPVADPGGETMYGVTARVARARGYYGRMDALPLDFAQRIAYEDYWLPNKCDQLPEILAYQVFDTAYHGGYNPKWLQAAVGTKVDGIVGANTVAAARACDQRAAAILFNRSRLDYLQSLKNWSENSRGWSDRIINNLVW